MAYLDHAGAGLPSDSQMDAVFENLKSIKLANPHSHHAAALATRQIVAAARLRILQYFNTDDYDVVFTSNATHSLQIVANTFDFGECQRAASTVEKTISHSSEPSFAYLLDSHNSVVGLRELVRNRVGHVVCVDYESIDWNNIPQTSRSLFVLTAMSNFCGRKYSLEHVQRLQEKGWSVCLDAASLLGTSPLDLSHIQPDFVAFSFYKIFGYPTGIGALLVKKSSQHLLNKSQFAGGTVAMADPCSFTVHQKRSFHERFEDGTPNYYSIAALHRGFDDLEKFGSITEIARLSRHLRSDAKRMLLSKHHWNGKPLVEIYEQANCENGPIIAFNLLRDDGSYIGYGEVAKMCELFGIQLRTGCFCNIGACMKYLGTTPEILHVNYLSGKQCGDEMDIINGKPAGAVRISFGRQSLMKDIDLLELVLDCCFLGAHPLPHEYPSSISIENFQPTLSQIHFYPVKSAQGTRSREAELAQSGFRLDRQFMVTSCDATLTNKKYPQLCSLQPMISDDQLIIKKEGMLEQLTIPLELNNNIPSKSVVCVNSVGISDCGSQAGDWLSKALNLADCKLMQVEADASRSLSNDSPFLLVNEASVQVLAEAIHLPRDDVIKRFRPNIVVKGLPAFMEDTASQIKIGSRNFEVVSKCTRCEMICVDPDTGEKDPALIIALRNYRNRDKMTFGIYLRQTDFESGQTLVEGSSVTFSNSTVSQNGV